MKQIAKLRKELEITAPTAGPSDEWSAAAELAEVERLAEMGVVVNPSGSTGKKRNKGKGKDVPTGHVIFAHGKDECELLLR